MWEPPRRPGTQSDPVQRLVDRHTAGYRLTAAKARSESMQLVGADVSKGKSFKSTKRIIRDFQADARRDLASTDQFYKDTLAKHVLDQYRIAAGDPNAKLSSRALQDYQRIFVHGMRDAETVAIGAERTLSRSLGELPDHAPRTQRKIIKRDALKGFVFNNGARWDYDKYMELSMSANAQRAGNVAFIHGSITAGVKFFEIIDGPDCGLVSHNSAPLASGMIVDADTALEHPIAHPHCQRSFRAVTDLDEDPSRVRGLVKDLIKSYAGAVIRDSIEQTVKNSLLKFAEDHQVKDRVAEWSAARMGDWPFRFTAKAAETGIDEASLIRDMASYADDIAAGRAVPQHIMEYLRLGEDVTARAVGDETGRWAEWHSRTVQAKLSGLSTAIDGVVHDPFWREVFMERMHHQMGYVPLRIGKFVRFSVPYVKGAETGVIRRPRLTLVGKDAFRAAVTRTDKGFINHLRLNPNGLVRLGLTQIEGTVVPTFSVIPKGPIRMVTRINRGAAGNITSLSTELRLITPKRYIDWANDLIKGQDAAGDIITSKLGVNFSTTLNLNLRQLGLNSFRDIKNLTLEDWRELRETFYFNPVTEKFEQHPALQLLSGAIHFRIGGGNMWDLAHTWRVPWEDARAYWTLTNLELKMADRVQDLEKILFDRHSKKIYDIHDVVHPYTRAQSRARRGGISLVDTGEKNLPTGSKLAPGVQQGSAPPRPGSKGPTPKKPKLVPLEPVPGEVQPPKPGPSRSGFKAPGVKADVAHIPEIAPRGQVLSLIHI